MSILLARVQRPIGQTLMIVLQTRYTLKVCGLHNAHLNMWTDCRGSLISVYNDGEISTCGQIVEVHLVQSTMMGRSQHVGRL